MKLCWENGSSRLLTEFLPAQGETSPLVFTFTFCRFFHIGTESLKCFESWLLYVIFAISDESSFCCSKPLVIKLRSRRWLLHLLYLYTYIHIVKPKLWRGIIWWLYDGVLTIGIGVTDLTLDWLQILDPHWSKICHWWYFIFLTQWEQESLSSVKFCPVLFWCVCISSTYLGQ